MRLSSMGVCLCIWPTRASYAPWNRIGCAIGANASVMIPNLARTQVWDPHSHASTGRLPDSLPSETMIKDPRLARTLASEPMNLAASMATANALCVPIGPGSTNLRDAPRRRASKAPSQCR